MLPVVSSSSGPGRLVLIQEIAGSTPAGTTMVSELPPPGAFFVGYNREEWAQILRSTLFCLEVDM